MLPSPGVWFIGAFAVEVVAVLLCIVLLLASYKDEWLDWCSDAAFWALGVVISAVGVMGISAIIMAH